MPGEQGQRQRARRHGHRQGGGQRQQSAARFDEQKRRMAAQGFHHQARGLESVAADAHGLTRQIASMTAPRRRQQAQQGGIILGEAAPQMVPPGPHGHQNCLPKPSTRDHILAAIRRWTRFRDWDDLAQPEALPPSPAAKPDAAGPPALDDWPHLDGTALHRLARETDAATATALAESFAGEALRRAQAITAAVDAGDAEALELNAHALSSSAATFGALRLHHLARTIEGYCLDGIVASAMRLALSLPVETDRALNIMAEVITTLQADHPHPMETDINAA